MEIGIHSFGELVPDPHTRQKLSAHERLKNVIQMAILVDEVGLDIFALASIIASTLPPQRRRSSWPRLRRLPSISVSPAPPPS